jgi:hypothetical protein
VRPQPLERLGGDALRADLVLAAEAREEVVDEERDVVQAVAQRRHLDVHDVQPVEEVVAEPAGTHLGGQVAVRRRDHADVDGDREARADRRHLALLDGAQELRLQRERYLGDLVEEERAALGGAEDPVVVAHGAREGTAPMAEELAVEQRFGQTRAVDRDERMGGERAALMDRARDELLPGASRRSPARCSCSPRPC